MMSRIAEAGICSLERPGSGRPAVCASANEPALRGREWIVQQWDRARLAAGDAGSSLKAFEVKSGRRSESQPGLDAFAAGFRPTRRLLVGTGGVAVEEFLSRPVSHWIG